MGIIFMDGLERGTVNSGLWTTISSYAATPAPSYGFTGTYCLSNAATSGYIEKDFGTTYSELYFTFKIRWVTSEGYPYGVIMFSDSAKTTILTVDVNQTTRKIEFHLGDSTTDVIDTGNAYTIPDAVNLVEVYYKPLNTNGRLIVKLNCVTEIDYTGDTTAGLENVQWFRFGYDGTYRDGTFYDDIAVSDSDWIGNIYIQSMLPNAAGDSTQWTPSTGSNYACVDEKLASDSDYISVNTSDQVDLYNMTDPVIISGSSISSVVAINLMTRMAYEGTPIPTKQKLAIKIASTEYYGSDVSPTLSFVYYNHLWALNPNTSAAWTEQNLKDLQIGVKSVA